MKTTKKNTKTNAAPTYTRLDFESVGNIILEATQEYMYDFALLDDIRTNFELEESETYAGTFFIIYAARTWRDSVAFAAAVQMAALNNGCIAHPSQTWRDEQKGEGNRRLVSVYVAAADLYDDNGNAKI